MIISAGVLATAHHLNQLEEIAQEDRVLQPRVEDKGRPQHQEGLLLLLDQAVGVLQPAVAEAVLDAADCSL